MTAAQKYLLGWVVVYLLLAVTLFFVGEGYGAALSSFACLIYAGMFFGERGGDDIDD